MFIKNLFTSLFIISAMALLSGCGGQSYQSDEDFIAEMQEKARDPKYAEKGIGIIDPNAENPPKIELDQKEFDMGFISMDEPTEKEMLVHNRGGQPVTVSKITTECICTEAKMKDDVIPPSESRVMIIRVDPKRFKGFQTTKVLTIYSTDPINTQLFLPVTSTIKGEVTIDPNPIEFGMAKAEDELEQVIQLTQSQPDEVYVVQELITPSGMPEQFSFELRDVPKEEWKDQTLAEHQLIAKVAPGLAPGEHKFKLGLDISHPRYKNFSVPVSVTIK